MAAYRDPRKEAVDYLEKHNLFRLFDILGSKLAVVKPEDPNAFLMAELMRIASLRQSGHPVTLFTEQDINAMFAVFDITNRGYLTQAQYHKALNAVGVAAPVLQVPSGEAIDKKTFVAYINAEVLQNAYR